jgi:hypothetical protein
VLTLQATAPVPMMFAFVRVFNNARRWPSTNEDKEIPTYLVRRGYQDSRATCEMPDPATEADLEA